jgi:hypothetical protein
MVRRGGVAEGWASIPGAVTVLEHIYDIPSDEELSRLVGSATPHFSLQIRERVASYAAALPPDHPRQAELARHLARLDVLSTEGESAGLARLDLPPRAPMRPTSG